MYETKQGDSPGAVYIGHWDLAEYVRRQMQKVPFEAFFWVAGLAAMATMDPRGDHLISLCPLDAMGLSFCPGCGLGHAIAYLARGNLVESVRAHPLGIPAVLILVVHVGRLVHRSGRDASQFRSS